MLRSAPAASTDSSTDLNTRPNTDGWVYGCAPTASTVAPTSIATSIPRARHRTNQAAATPASMGTKLSGKRTVTMKARDASRYGPVPSRP